jgi:hypothetical protein
MACLGSNEIGKSCLQVLSTALSCPRYLGAVVQPACGVGQLGPECTKTFYGSPIYVTMSTPAAGESFAR